MLNNITAAVNRRHVALRLSLANNSGYTSLRFPKVTSIYRFFIRLLKVILINILKAYK